MGSIPASQATSSCVRFLSWRIFRNLLPNFLIPVSSLRYFTTGKIQGNRKIFYSQICIANKFYLYYTCKQSAERILKKLPVCGIGSLTEINNLQCKMFKSGLSPPKFVFYNNYFIKKTDMKKITIAIMFLTITSDNYAQTKKEQKNVIGISVPLIWNNSNGIYYSVGNRKEPTGNAISYGMNVNYAKSLYKNYFFYIGAGYFKQSFNIIRPFNFDGDTITNLLYSTKNYSYHCFQLQAGIGYSYKFNERFKITGVVIYNSLNSYRQNYVPTGLSGYEHKPTQTNNISMQIGYMLNLSVGIEKIITNNISIGADIVTPIITRWKNDEIFIEYLYANDTQQIAENRFSIGTVISCKYHF